MTADELRNVYGAEPFHPFTLHLADGRNVHVPHSEFIAISPRGRTAVVYSASGSFNVVDVQLVADIEVNGNGESPLST
jgi:hypothetical protein